MKKTVITIVIAVLAATAALAQQPRRAQLSDEEREQWLSEMRNFKHEFLARELDLSAQQQAQFFPIYDQMDDALNQISADTRDLEAKVRDDDQASDIEIEAAARALFEQKSREGEVEKAYFENFKEILTPQQLLRLKNAERKFTQQLVRQRGKTSATPQRRKQ